VFDWDSSPAPRLFVGGDYLIRPLVGGTLRNAARDASHTARKGASPGVTSSPAPARHLAGSLLTGHPRISGHRRGLQPVKASGDHAGRGVSRNLPKAFPGPGMKQSGRSHAMSWRSWGATIATSGIAAALGYTYLGHASGDTVAVDTVSGSRGYPGDDCRTMIPRSIRRKAADRGGSSPWQASY